MKSLSVIAILLVLFFFLGSCIKKNEFPPNPIIEYKSFEKRGNDSAIFSFTFTDGDGDIGLDEEDTLGNFAPGEPYYYNFIMTYYYKDAGGNFVPYDANPATPGVLDTLRYRYRIPDITPEGQNKVLDGEMKILLLAPYYGIGHQQFKFEAHIFDRSLQKSNVISTPELTP